MCLGSGGQIPLFAVGSKVLLSWQGNLLLSFFGSRVILFRIMKADSFNMLGWFEAVGCSLKQEELRKLTTFSVLQEAFHVPPSLVLRPVPFKPYQKTCWLSVVVLIEILSKDL